MRGATQSVWCIISLVTIHSTSADLIESQDHHRRRRSLTGDMNLGNQIGAGGMQGFNNVGPSDGLRNPEKPHLESIYRGKVVWGNETERGAKNEEIVFGKGRFADVETDKFGNPVGQPRRGPRPRINPLKKEDVKEDEGGRRRRNADDALRPNIELNTDHLTSEQERKYHEFRANNDQVMDLIENNMDQSINTVIKKAEEQKLVRKRSINQQKRVLKIDQREILGQHGGVGFVPDTKESLSNRLEKSPIEDRHEESPFEFGKIEKGFSKDNLIKSPFEDILDQSPFEFRKMEKNIQENYIARSPLNNPNLVEAHAVQKREVSHDPSEALKIESIKRGPEIESRYKGPVIRSQYMGPQIRSQYMGPQIRSQYMGPQILSEYKGKVIGMLGGMNAYEAFVKAQKAAGASTPQVLNLAQKYDRMNREAEIQKLMEYVRNKPKLAKIFKDR